MALVLGMQCVQYDALARDPSRVARLADLVTDSRWFYRFKLIDTRWEPGQPPAPRFKGVIPAAKLRATALEALSSPSVANVNFGVSAKEALDHAHGLDVRRLEVRAPPRAADVLAAEQPLARAVRLDLLRVWMHRPAARRSSR